MKLFASLLSYRENPIASVMTIPCDGIHVDVMDGTVTELQCHYHLLLPQIKMLNKPIQVHIMSNASYIFIQDLIKHKPEVVFIHPCWTDNYDALMFDLKQNNIQLGVVWNDDNCFDLVKTFDQVLFMTVPVGQSGQNMILNRIDKIASLASTINKPMWIDGGVSLNTLQMLYNLPIEGVIVGSKLEEVAQILKPKYNTA